MALVAQLVLHDEKTVGWDTYAYFDLTIRDVPLADIPSLVEPSVDRMVARFNLYGQVLRTKMLRDEELATWYTDSGAARKVLSWSPRDTSNLYARINLQMKSLNVDYYYIIYFTNDPIGHWGVPHLTLRDEITTPFPRKVT